MRFSWNSCSFCSDSSAQPRSSLLGLHQVFDLRQEPGVDAAEFLDLLERHAFAKRVRNVENALGPGFPQFAPQRGQPHLRLVAFEDFIQTVAARFQAAQRFLQ